MRKKKKRNIEHSYLNIGKLRTGIARLWIWGKIHHQDCFIQFWFFLKDQDLQLPSFFSVYELFGLWFAGYLR